MDQNQHSAAEARQPVFDTENLADEAVATSNPEKKSFWSRFALKAILKVDLDEDIEPKPLSEADVDDVCRGALAGGLTPHGIDASFNE